MLTNAHAVDTAISKNAERFSAPRCTAQVPPVLAVLHSVLIHRDHMQYFLCVQRRFRVGHVLGEATCNQTDREIILIDIITIYAK